MGDSIDVGPTWSEPRLAAISCLQNGRRELIEKKPNSLGIRTGWDPLYDLIPDLVHSSGRSWRGDIRDVDLCEVGPRLVHHPATQRRVDGIEKEKGDFRF